MQNSAERATSLSRFAGCDWGLVQGLSIFGLEIFLLIPPSHPSIPPSRWLLCNHTQEHSTHFCAPPVCGCYNMHHPSKAVERQPTGNLSECVTDGDFLFYLLWRNCFVIFPFPSHSFFFLFLLPSLEPIPPSHHHPPHPHSPPDRLPIPDSTIPPGGSETACHLDHPALPGPDSGVLPLSRSNQAMLVLAKGPPRYPYN